MERRACLFHGVKIIKSLGNSIVDLERWVFRYVYLYPRWAGTCSTVGTDIKDYESCSGEEHKTGDTFSERVALLWTNKL